MIWFWKFLVHRTRGTPVLKPVSKNLSIGQVQILTYYCQIITITLGHFLISRFIIVVRLKRINFSFIHSFIFTGQYNTKGYCTITDVVGWIKIFLLPHSLVWLLGFGANHSHCSLFNKIQFFLTDKIDNEDSIPIFFSLWRKKEMDLHNPPASKASREVANLTER